mmetsp:Transcript_97652/g.273235  ORF Transcript_97652/g.273235 Transcript_97652/m.273235 type:complete len:248 (+) Transcript_97652:322-1065(+)
MCGFGFIIVGRCSDGACALGSCGSSSSSRAKSALSQSGFERRCQEGGIGLQLSRAGEPLQVVVSGRMSSQKRRSRLMAGCPAKPRHHPEGGASIRRRIRPQRRRLLLLLSSPVGKWRLAVPQGAFVCIHVIIITTIVFQYSEGLAYQKHVHGGAVGRLVVGILHDAHGRGGSLGRRELPWRTFAFGLPVVFKDGSRLGGCGGRLLIVLILVPAETGNGGRERAIFVLLFSPLMAGAELAALKKEHGG